VVKLKNTGTGLEKSWMWRSCNGNGVGLYIFNGYEAGTEFNYFHRAVADMKSDFAQATLTSNSTLTLGAWHHSMCFQRTVTFEECAWNDRMCFKHTGCSQIILYKNFAGIDYSNTFNCRAHCCTVTFIAANIYACCHVKCVCVTFNWIFICNTLVVVDHLLLQLW